MMTLNRFTTRGKRTAKATRQVLQAVYKDLALAAQQALMNPDLDYHIRYQFDHSAPGTGCVLPTDPGSWYSTGHTSMGYFERENWNWKPLRLTSQGYRRVATVRTDDYATTGYSAGSYVKLGLERLTKEWEGKGHEVYIRPANFYHHFTRANRIHGCWGWSGEDFQVWVRPNAGLAARIAG